MIIGRVPRVCLRQQPSLINAVEVVVVVVVVEPGSPLPVQEADISAHTGRSPGVLITPDLSIMTGLLTAEAVTLLRAQLVSAGDREGSRGNLRQSAPG